jgi:hypothetical protein
LTAWGLSGYAPGCISSWAERRKSIGSAAPAGYLRSASLPLIHAHFYGSPKELQTQQMAIVAVGQRDRSVKALAPDGALRRTRFSQEDALFLVARNVALAKWNRKRTRISCIQFFGELAEPITPRRWLKTGTRYSYREEVEGGAAWTHKRLPYGAVDAESGYVEPPEVLDMQLRALFCEVPLSIVHRPVRKPAQVISIDAGRQKATKPIAPAVAFPAQKVA